MIAEDENLDTAEELGFGTIRRDNRFLARKYNDGLQLACDPSVNPRPADYAVPMGRTTGSTTGSCSARRRGMRCSASAGSPSSTRAGAS